MTSSLDQLLFHLEGSFILLPATMKMLALERNQHSCERFTSTTEHRGESFRVSALDEIRAVHSQCSDLRRRVATGREPLCVYRTGECQTAGIRQHATIFIIGQVSTRFAESRDSSATWRAAYSP
jgi:hypothetical protein